jgi:2,4-dienoyl-CoA reductase-like NADH-dependent reductase (Old Yellow Enzyme family)
MTAASPTGDPAALLRTPLRVGRVVLRNRIVCPPMERNYCALDGTVTGRYVAYLRARATGGAALLFTEAAYVRDQPRRDTEDPARYCEDQAHQARS